MQKVLISLPDQLVLRMRAAIPRCQLSNIITRLIEQEVEARERKLYECALAVENNQALNEEMADWGITLTDGLKNDLG